MTGTDRTAENLRTGTTSEVVRRHMSLGDIAMTTAAVQPQNKLNGSEMTKSSTEREQPGNE